MSVPDTTTDNTNTESAITIRLDRDAHGFAWNETIDGAVTLYPHPTNTVTYSVVSIAVVTQDADGFTSPVGFAGMRDPLNPLMGTALPTDAGTLGGAPPEMTWGEIVVARDVTVAPGSVAPEIAFALPVPPRIALGDMCFVSARAVATDGVDSDRHAAVPFVLRPPHTIQAVQNALRTIGDFRAISITDTPGDADAGHAFSLDYAAPDSLLTKLDGIRFDLVETDTQISGMAVINPQEHTLADHLRSFVHADRIRIPVAFDREELDAAGKAGLPAESVTVRLHELLDPFLIPVPTP